VCEVRTRAMRRGQPGHLPHLGPRHAKHASTIIITCAFARQSFTGLWARPPPACVNAQCLPALPAHPYHVLHIQTMSCSIHTMSIPCPAHPYHVLHIHTMSCTSIPHPYHVLQRIHTMSCTSIPCPAHTMSCTSIPHPYHVLQHTCTHILPPHSHRRAHAVTPCPAAAQCLPACLHWVINACRLRLRADTPAPRACKEAPPTSTPSTRGLPGSPSPADTTDARPLGAQSSTPTHTRHHSPPLWFTTHPARCAYLWGPQMPAVAAASPGPPPPGRAAAQTTGSSSAAGTHTVAQPMRRQVPECPIECPMSAP